MGNHAFCRVETVDDLCDVTRLLLAGFDVAVEPVAGAMAGPTRPLNIVSKRRGRDILEVEDTTDGLVGALAYLLRKSFQPCFDPNKVVQDAYFIDFASVGEDRRAIVTTAFEGIVGVLNRRALQILSACDIADLLEWIHPLAPDTRLDLQLPYGHPSYPWFVRRAGTDVFENEAHRPEVTKATRTIVCHVRPSRDDLDAILSVVVSSGRTLGIVNAKTAGKRLSGFRGMSADKSLVLPNRGVATSYAVDISPYAKGPDRWAFARAEAAAKSRLFDIGLVDGLQGCWADQHNLRRIFSIEIEGGDENDRNHARDGAYAACAGPRPPGCAYAESWTLEPMTLAVTSSTLGESKGLGALKRQCARVDCVDHNAGATILVPELEGPLVADALIEHWDRFVGADFRALSISDPNSPSAAA